MIKQQEDGYLDARKRVIVGGLTFNFLAICRFGIPAAYMSIICCSRPSIMCVGFFFPGARPNFIPRAANSPKLHVCADLLTLVRFPPTNQTQRPKLWIGCYHLIHIRP